MRTDQDALLSVQRWLAGLLPEPWEIVLRVDEGRPPRRPYALVESLPALDTATTSRASQEITMPVTIGLHLGEAESRKLADEAALAVRERIWQAVKVGPDVRRPRPDMLPLWSFTPRLEHQRVRVHGAGTFALVLDLKQTVAMPVDVDAATIAAELAAFDDVGAGNVEVSRRGVGLWDVEFVGDLAGVRPGVLAVDDSDLDGSASVHVMAEGMSAPWRTGRDWMRVVSFGMRTLRDLADPKVVMVMVDLRLTWVRGTSLPSGPVMQRVTASGGVL